VQALLKWKCIVVIHWICHNNNKNNGNNNKTLLYRAIIPQSGLKALKKI
jgi:hypothetical protein